MEARFGVGLKRMPEQLTAVVLLEDALHIDTTELTAQRNATGVRHGDGFRQLAADVPYSTWDDHDGRNDTDGRLEGKANSRQAFMEHRPNPGFARRPGHLHELSRGGRSLHPRHPLVRPHEGEEDNPPCSGRGPGLKRDARPRMRVHRVCNGMVFNDAVHPGKTDCWGAIPRNTND